MRKVPTLFQRDPDDMRRLLLQVHPDCQWVLNGEGVATRKYDGTCVMYDGTWWARREVKPGKQFPAEFRLAEHDHVTGKSVGWEPIDQSPFRKPFQEAVEPLAQFGVLIGQDVPEGTYELVGPKINGNPERCETHRLERHATAEQVDHGYFLDDTGGMTFASVRTAILALAEDGWEGVVWHHPDGRYAKLKARDFRA